MDNLRIKIKFGEAEIELEGDRETVLKEFQDLKVRGINSLLPDLPSSQFGKSGKHQKKTKKKVKNEGEIGSEKVKDSKPKNKHKPSSFKILPDLNYKPKGKKSLIDFIKGLPFGSNPEKTLGIVYYCKETLGIEKVTTDHIFTGFKELKIPIPPTLYQGIVNLKNRTGWLTFEKTDDITYSIQGGNFIEHDLPKKKVNGGS
jgi:hypothetical protein